MSILNAVFSYNRGDLLANCIASLRQFGPDGPIRIYDDDSDDASTRAVLASLAASGAEVVVSSSEQRLHHGNLYRNMDRAARDAYAEGYELVHFVQDDCQVLWRRADLIEHAHKIFGSDPRAIQLQVHFLKRLGRSRAVPVAGFRAHRILTTGGDLGLFAVARLRENGLSFEPNERAWGLRALAAGLNSYATADPIIARVPWPRAARFGTMRGSAAPSASGPLLGPLSDATVQRLVSRDLELRPYGEDWYAPRAYRCWAPYHHDPSLAGWLFAIARGAVSARSMRGFWPRRVGPGNGDPARSGGRRVAHGTPGSASTE